MNTKGVLLTESTANWATQQQRQSRPLPGHRPAAGQGIFDRPSGGIWFYGEVQSINAATKTASVRVDIASYGHNPALDDTGEVTISWALDAGVTTIELTQPEVGASYWFQLCHVPGDVQGAERSPPKWVMLKTTFEASSEIPVYTLAIKGNADGGTVSWEGGTIGSATVTHSGTLDWDATDDDVRTAIAAGLNSTVSVVGGPWPFGTIKVRLTNDTWFRLVGHTLTTEANGQTATIKYSLCFENATWWAEI